MSMFDRRFRGFRIVNFTAMAVLLMLMLGVYLAKTRASADSAAITRTEHQILAEQQTIHTLKAQVASLENSKQIEKMSVDYLKMAPVDAKHELTPDQLPALAGQSAAPAPQPAVVQSGASVR